MFRTKTLREIFEKTNGHCHFCGDIVVFECYGVKDVTKEAGVWEADHVIQKGKGGSKTAENCLPACFRCNRLRWHRSGSEVRELISLGIVVKSEIKKNTETGKKILALNEKRLAQNLIRRRTLGS